MAQALCWLAARFVGLAAILAVPGAEPCLLPAPGRAAVLPGWAERLFRRAGLLRRGETPVAAAALGSAARARLAAQPAIRAEFMPGAVGRFRALALREAHDFALLKQRMTATA